MFWRIFVDEDSKIGAVPCLLLFLCVVWGVNHSTGLLEITRGTLTKYSEAATGGDL